MKKWILAFSFALIAVILLGAAIIMPWYQLSHKVTGISEWEKSWVFKLQEITFNDADGNETTTPYTDEEHKDEKATAVIINTFYITIIALIMSVLLLVFAIVGGIKGGKVVVIAVIFGVLAFLLALIGPIYMMAALPGAMGEDIGDVENKPKFTESFFGSDKNEYFLGEDEYSWGGTTGWFLAIVASVFNLVSFVILLMVMREPQERLTGAPPHPGYPPVQSQQPLQPGVQYPPMQQPQQFQNAPAGGLCPYCTEPLTFLSQENRHYCNYCKKYV